MSIHMDRSNIDNENALAGHMQAEKKKYNGYWMSDGIENDVRWGVTAWGGGNAMRLCEANFPWFQAHFKRELECGLMTMELRESYPGSGDGYIFIEAAICRHNDTTRKRLAMKLYDWFAELDDYPYCDGTGTHVTIDGRTYADASEYEWELNSADFQRVIHEEPPFTSFVSDDAPEDWGWKVASWVGEHYPEEEDNQDGGGPYPKPEVILAALFEACPEALSDDYATNEMVIERRQTTSYGNSGRPEYYVVPLALRGSGRLGRDWLNLEYIGSGQDQQAAELDAWLRCYEFINRYGFVWTTGQNVTVR